MSSLRRLRIRSSGSAADHPVAWSMVNIDCQERAMAVQYALAAADPITGEVPPMKEADLTDQRIAELAAQPAYDAAMVSIAGPLIADQVLIGPDGMPLPGAPNLVSWSYHHATAVNIEGEIKVVDLSIGDEPLSVEEWAHGFVDPSMPCAILDEDEFESVWVYWLAAMSNFETPERPANPCGCLLTPIFTYHWHKPPEAAQIRWTPGTLEGKNGGFRYELNSRGVSLEEDLFPSVLSVYTPRTEEELCDIFHYAYCNAGRFLRGDSNYDGKVDVSDPIDILGFLFLDGGFPPPCLEALDSDASGTVDLSDAIFALGFLFLGGAKIPEPFPECGMDPKTGTGCSGYTGPCS